MRVSFIIPVFNCEKYIERCLKSIRRQGLNSYEIVVVDDGSTDSTPDICNRAASEDSRIHVIHQENRGISAARNAGILLARGNYIAFLDSDDYYCDQTIQELLRKAEEKELDIVCGDYTEISDSQIIEKNRTCLRSDIMDGETFLGLALEQNAMPMPVWLSLYRRNFILECNLFFKDGFNHEDELWTPQAYVLARRVQYVPVNFYGYYIHCDSITHSKKRDKIAGFIIPISHELKELSKTLKNEKTKAYLQNNIVSIYLSGQYSLRSQDRDQGFFDEMWVDDHNRRKVKLYLASRNLYYFVNSTFKNLLYFGRVITKTGAFFCKVYQYAFSHIKKFIRSIVVSKEETKRLTNHSFSLICNTCNGGVISSELSEQFRSPTVNLFIMADDFIRFLEHFNEYINMELVELSNNFLPYPVGELGDIKIYFMHYKSFAEAKEKWEDRKARINFDDLYFLMAQKDFCTEDHLVRFEQLPYKNKLIVTADNHPELLSAVYSHEYHDGDEVDVLTDFVGLAGHRKYDYVFDYVSWLNDGGLGKRYQK